MDFLVLGPLVAASDEAVPLDLGAPKARAVLAVLLCRPGQMVGTDAIVDALWPENPPATAVKNIQLYVHQLRRALGDARRIGRHGGGYVLAAEPDEIDAARFTRLVNRHRAAVTAGDLERARALLAQALGLWRAEQAYADIEDVPPVTGEAHRLAEARLAAMRSRIDIDLRLGQHDELVAELTTLTEKHPLHEQFWTQLITALHRSGRPADALAAYDRARRIITEETGLDPGPELRGLQQAILADEPNAPPRMLPPDVGDFTGRRNELAAITAAQRTRPKPALPGGTDGVVPVIALSGQGGVGKTALAVHAAHALTDAYPDGQLFAALAGAQPAPADPAEILARFLRALGVPGTAVPDTGDERGTMYRSLLAERKLLLVLDDAAGEAQVQALLPGTASCAVIVTSRARLGGLAGARHIDLAPLPSVDGYQLLARITGPARAASDPGATRELVRLCAGLPLALRIAGSRLTSRPHWSIGELAVQLADERSRLDALRHRDLELRASFSLSYGGLGPGEQRMFRLLGLLQAPDVTCWTAAALLDTTLAEGEELLEMLADARLLDVTGPDEAGRRRYRFHDLVRLYANELAEAEETASDRTAALSRVFAMLLSVTDAVRRVVAGGDYARIVGQAPRWRAAEVAAEVHAAPKPMAVLRAELFSLVAATHQAAALGMDEVCWQLCVGAGVLYQTGAYFDHWHDTYQTALAAVRAAGNGRGEAIMLLFLASYYSARRSLSQAIECADRALALFEQIGDRYGHALTMRRSSQYERFAGHFDEAIARSQRAHDLLTSLDDPAAAADCLVMEGITRLDTGDPAAAADVLARALKAAHAVRAGHIAAQSSYWLVLAHIALGRIAEAAQAATELSQFVRMTDDQIGVLYAYHARGCLSRAEGNLAVARREFQTGLDVAREIRDPLMQVRILADLGELCGVEGKHAEAVSLLTQAVAISEDLDFPLARARALLRLGDARAAADDVDGALAARTEAAAIAANLDFPTKGKPLYGPRRAK